MNFRVFDTPRDVAAGLAQTLVESVKAIGEETVTIALSGGSTPRALYEILGTGDHRQQLDLQRIIWIVGDERNVPSKDPSSNSGMIRDSLFREGMAPSHTFLTFRTELEEPARIAADFERAWSEAGVESLHITVLGVGDDGHTASLFPGTTALEVTDRIATEVFVPKFDAWRFTLTLPILRAAASKFVAATGAGKRQVVDQARKSEPLPIVLVAEQEGESWWFVDREAYGE